MIKALIFDFDGLIVDTETAEYISWQEAFAPFNCELPLTVWQQAIGGVDLFDPLNYLEEQLGHPIDREAIATKRRQRDHELIAQLTEPLPGVMAYLDEATQLGLKVAVASSSTHQWVDNLLPQLGLNGRFQTIRCRDDVDNKAKPDPAVYLAAAAALSVAPSEAMALEDSYNGSLAAKRAGLYCVAVPNQMTRLMNFDHVDYRLTALTDMPLSQLMQEVIHAQK